MYEIYIYIYMYIYIYRERERELERGREREKERETSVYTSCTSECPYTQIDSTEMYITLGKNKIRSGQGTWDISTAFEAEKQAGRGK